MRESVIETRLRNGVKAMGGICWKFVSPGTAGVPDRLIILPGGKMAARSSCAARGKPP